MRSVLNYAFKSVIEKDRHILKCVQDQNNGEQIAAPVPYMLKVIKSNLSYNPDNPYEIPRGKQYSAKDILSYNDNVFMQDFINRDSGKLQQVVDLVAKGNLQKEEVRWLDYDWT